MTIQLAAAYSLRCPGIKFSPDRDANDATESIDYFWTLLNDFGYQHCLYGCMGCLGHMSKDKKAYLPPEPTKKYAPLFADLHDALGQFPDLLYRHLCDITGNNCPACAVLTAMQQFSEIARYSPNPPVNWDTQPCYFEDDMDNQCNHFTSSVRHIEALRALDMNKLPSRMPPNERRNIKSKISNGKAVVEFLHDYIDGKVKLTPIMTNGELWAILACESLIEDIRKTISKSWIHWAKAQILDSPPNNISIHLCKIACVAISCYSNIREEIRFVPEVTEFDRMRDILIAAYYYYNGTVLSHDGFDNALRQWLTGYFFKEFGDFGRIYCSPTALGMALGKKHGGTPPPFFQDESEIESEQVPAAMTLSTDTTITEIIDTDVTTNTQAVATGGEGGSGGNATSQINNNPVNNLQTTFEKDAMKQVNHQSVVVHDESASMIKELRGLLDDEHKRRMSTVLETPPPATNGGDKSPSQDRLIEGAIAISVKGDINDGDAIFHGAKIALKGAREKTGDIVFLPQNKHHKAAQDLLLYLSGLNGFFDMEVVKGICLDAGLKDSNAVNIRDLLDTLICGAAGLQTKGDGKPKAFIYDSGKKGYITKLSFSIHSLDE